ncbi:Uncharacterised protein [Corynebacterium amycolatum]|nr:Uncharacterised protein [Corynebacterium amycolatum]
MELVYPAKREQHLDAVTVFEPFSSSITHKTLLILAGRTHFNIGDCLTSVVDNYIELSVRVFEPNISPIRRLLPFGDIRHDLLRFCEFPLGFSSDRGTSSCSIRTLRSLFLRELRSSTGFSGFECLPPGEYGRSNRDDITNYCCDIHDYQHKGR